MAKWIRYVGCLPVSFLLLPCRNFPASEERKKKIGQLGLCRDRLPSSSFQNAGWWGETGLLATPTPTSHHHSRIHPASSLKPNHMHCNIQTKNIVVSCDALFCALHIHIQALKP